MKTEPDPLPIGASAPPFALADTGGRRRRLEEFDAESFPDDDAPAVRAIAAEHDLPFPYLRDTLDALSAGEPVAEPETYAIGCTVKWKPSNFPEVG